MFEDDLWVSSEIASQGSEMGSEEADASEMTSELVQYGKRDAETVECACSAGDRASDLLFTCTL